MDGRGDQRIKQDKPNSDKYHAFAQMCYLDLKK
jgi:hypothetical protein